MSDTESTPTPAEVVTPEAKPAPPAEKQSTESSVDYAARIAALEADVAHWKHFSRKHEEEAEALKKEKKLDQILSETGLPESAKQHLTGKNEEEWRQKAISLKEIAAALVSTVTPTPAESVPAAPAAKIVQPNPLQGVTSAEDPSSGKAAVVTEVSKLFKK